ncbi:hypothetical protein D9M68_927770 [compost metagenome]
MVGHHRQQHGAVHHHRQRGAQVVAQHGGEHFVQVQRVLQFLQLRRQLLLLLVQLDKHLDLADQGLAVDGLEHEVDRARLVAPEAVARFARGGGQED